MFPALTPVTTPEPAPTDPVVGTLLVHVPPDDASLNVVVKPTHTFVTPVIAAGSGLTVTGVVAKQPVPKVYEIIGVPVANPATIPVPAPTDPSAGLLLLHVPPVVPSLNVVVEPTHTFVVPVITAGLGLTVIGKMTLQLPAARV